jgi:hypothetical protein
VRCSEKSTAELETTTARRSVSREASLAERGKRAAAHQVGVGRARVAGWFREGAL